MKATQPPIGQRGWQSQLHLPPTWWRFRTKVTRPVHYAHKRHNKSPCWEKWDPSAPNGHNNKFPSGSITHGPEPGTKTIIYLTPKNVSQLNISFLQQAVFHQATFCSDLIQVVSTAAGAMFTSNSLKDRQQTSSLAGSKTHNRRLVKSKQPKTAIKSDTVALELASCSLLGGSGGANTFRRGAAWEKSRDGGCKGL